MSRLPESLPQPRDAEIYAPLKGRRRWLVGAAGVLTAVVVMWLMTRHVKPEPPVQPASTEPGLCQDGQTQGCVGGQAAVFAVPAQAASTPGR